MSVFAVESLGSQIVELRAGSELECGLDGEPVSKPPDCEIGGDLDGATGDATGDSEDHVDGDEDDVDNDDAIGMLL